MKKDQNPWWPLFVTNFFGVFNDNVIKWLVIFIGVNWVSTQYQAYVVPVASAMLVIPFILFSPIAGRFAKIYKKKRIMVLGKLAEIPIMIVAIIGFILQNLPIVMTAVLLMGLQSTMFSPAKYGLIRDIRGKDGISFGTGMMEMLTFVGMLMGTVLAGVLSEYFKEDYNVSLLSIILLVVAFIGWLTAKVIKADETKVLESPNDTLNPIFFIWKQFKISRHFIGVNDAVFGLSMFWLIGSMIQMNIAVHSPIVLGENDQMTGIIMSVAAIGIAIGAILTGWLSGKNVHRGYVVIGSIGLAIVMFLIVSVNPSTKGFMIMIFTAAFFAGFFKIPLNSHIQDVVKGRKLGDILGYLNVMVFTFILVSAGIFAVFNMLTSEEVLVGEEMKEIGDTQIIFAFIGIASLLTGVYYYFKVAGVKEDFLNLISGRLGRE